VSEEVDEFLRRFAPEDVRAAVEWLLGQGFVLTGRSPQTRLGTFGSSLTYTGDATVIITVDRSQWHMDVAPPSGAKAIGLDLLIAAQAGRPYWEVFAATDLRAGQPNLPSQLPPGVSWREKLPTVLTWLATTEHLAVSVALARDQRFAVTWPDSAKAKALRRTWRARDMPVPSAADRRAGGV